MVNEKGQKRKKYETKQIFDIVTHPAKSLVAPETRRSPVPDGSAFADVLCDETRYNHVTNLPIGKF